MNDAPPVLLPCQCRAGRALVGMRQEDLARRAGCSRAAVQAFETGQRPGALASRRAMRDALEASGVDLLDGDRPGVRLLPGAPAD